MKRDWENTSKMYTLKKIKDKEDKIQKKKWYLDMILESITQNMLRTHERKQVFWDFKI